MAARAADGVEPLERKAEGIDPRVAAGATFVAAMFLRELPLGQPGWRFLRQDRSVLRRAGQPFAQDGFAEPVPPQDRTGARGAALLRERGGEPENPSAPFGPCAVNATPGIALHSTQA